MQAGTPLITNNYYLAYESGRVEHYDKVKVPLADILSHLTPDTSLALALKAHDNEARKTLDADPRLTPLQRFANSRGDEVRIYAVH